MDDRGITHIVAVSPVAMLEQDADVGSPTYLIVQSGGITGAMIPLSQGSNWIGRAPDNSLQLPSASVSRHHAVIRLGDHSQATITDLSSTNGTFVNGTRIGSNRPTPVKDGDRIRLGPQVLFRFSRPNARDEQLQRELFERSVRDSLTGLYNRAYFLDRMRSLGASLSSKGLGLGVMMVDVDHFKRVNDLHGHPVGDSVLCEVAGVLRQCTRSDDLVARYGGEEFILAIPSISLKQALQRAERMRVQISERPFRLPDPAQRITVSIGLAYARADRPFAPQSLIAMADLQLYRAKESGRNRVMCEGEPSSADEHSFIPPTTDGEAPHGDDCEGERQNEAATAGRLTTAELEAQLCI